MEPKPFTFSSGAHTSANDYTPKEEDAMMINSPDARAQKQKEILQTKLRQQMLMYKQQMNMKTVVLDCCGPDPTGGAGK